MCNNENNTCENCIADILKVILILQQSVCQNDCCMETCDRGFLGNSAVCLSCNTRPIMLYTCCGNGLPWSMPTTKDNTSCGVGTTSDTCSTVFTLSIKYAFLPFPCLHLK